MPPEEKQQRIRSELQITIGLTFNSRPDRTTRHAIQLEVRMSPSGVS